VESVYSAVRTESLHKTHFVFKGLNYKIIRRDASNYFTIGPLFLIVSAFDTLGANISHKIPDSLFSIKFRIFTITTQYYNCSFNYEYL
jgi:hypothetical protein